MIDNHVHIDFEKINKDLDLYVEKAKEKDIEEFTITNHIMIPIKNPFYVIDNSRVFLRDLSFLKCSLISTFALNYFTFIKAKGYSNVNIGAEIDYLGNKEYMDEVRKVIEKTPFDLILGSLHILEGNNIARKKEVDEYLKTATPEEIHKKYFTKLKEVAKSDLFDVLSHPDLIRKHSPKVKFEEYSTEVEELIDSLLENDMGIEVNASGYVFMGDSYPSKEFLALSKEKGLEKVTIGSDAHKVEHIGENLDKVVEKLKSVGYEKIVKFKNRKPEYIRL